MRPLLFLALLFGSAMHVHAQRAYCVPDGTRAYFTFEQTFSNRAGAAANATGSNPRPSFALDARIGNYAASFDGIDDRLRYGFLTSSFANMTVMFWIRPATVDGVQTLFEEGGFTNGVAIRLDGTTLEAAVRESEVQFTYTHQTPIEADVWQHVALVYAAGNVTLYLNGDADTDPDGDTGFGSLASHTNNGGFGATLESDAFGEGSTTANSAANFYTGLVDDAAYYRGSAQENALTEAQIDATIACDPDIPFECNADVYVTQNGSTSLRRVDVTTSPFTFITVDDPVPFEYNAAGLNPQDNLAYAFKRGSSDRTLLRIAADGTLTDLGSFPEIAGGSANIYSGDVTPDGVFYIAHLNFGTDSLTAIDLSTTPYTVEKLALDSNIDAADLAFNTVDGLLYGIASGNQDLVAIDPATGTVTREPVMLFNGGSLPNGNYGATWFNAIGQLFAYYNEGRIYRIALSGEAPIATLVSTSPAVLRTDGFSCTTAPVSADVGIDKEVVGEPQTPVEAGDALVYTVDVVNGGPSISTNVVVEDVLPDDLVFVAASVDSLSTGGALDPDRYILDTPEPGTNGTVTLSLADLALRNPNAVRLTIQTEATEASPVIPMNTAVLVSADQTDPNPANDQDSVGGTMTDASTEAAAEGFRLEAPHPNPFRRRATIRYAVPSPGPVSLEVYDVTGRRVAVLVDGVQDRGLHEVVFDPSGLATGSYVSVLRAGESVASQWLTVVR